MGSNNTKTSPCGGPHIVTKPRTVDDDWEKVVLLGRLGAGRTAIQERFVANTFDDYGYHHGFAIQSK